MSDMPLKRCSTCKEEFPATLQFFYRFKDGLWAQCKSCKDTKQRAYDKAHYSNPEAYKRRQEYLKTYYSKKENKERLRALASTPRGRENAKTYMQTHLSRPGVREQRLAQHRIYGKSYRQRPQTQENMRANNHARHARKMSVLGTHTTTQIQEQLKRQKHKCYYCSTKFEQDKGKYTYHIDHTFPLSRVAGTDIPANDISYLVLACPTCNMRKHNKFPHEFPEGGKLL